MKASYQNIMFTEKRKIGFKGKYCTGCGTVWEMSANTGAVGVVVKHPDFPSYGLERENCPTCVKVSPKAEPGMLTTLDKHKKLLQRLADENQEMLLIKKFKKNVKK